MKLDAALSVADTWAKTLNTGGPERVVALAVLAAEVRRLQTTLANERKRCAEIARNTVDHLASPLAPYNHGVMDAQTAIAAAIERGE